MPIARESESEMLPMFGYQLSSSSSVVSTTFSHTETGFQSTGLNTTVERSTGPSRSGPS